MLEVAVIGAGAAGLAASRHLIGCGLKPSIFESAKHVGGAWSSTSHNNNNSQGKMWDSLHTNLSKHTCCFSDFEWPATTSTSTYPSHVDMHRYLQDYSTTFIVDPTCFKFGCHVTNVVQQQANENDAENNDARYTVEWTEQDDDVTQSRDFDGVIVATGFFSQSYIPPAWKKTTTTNDQQLKDDDNNDWMIHSADYKTPQEFQDQTVAIIGSSFSALEIAVDVSRTASRVVTIVPSIPWVLPRYIPIDNGTVLPVDLALYRRRQDAPQPELVELSPQDISDRHAYLQNLVGTKKQSALGIPDVTQPPFVVISDDFLNLVQQGTIEVVHGSVAGVCSSSHTIEVQQAKDNEDNEASIATTGTLENIDRVIACTGYRPHLDFLDASILETLTYDPTDPFCPLLLAYDAVHPELPRLGFCGMYRASYFGVVELQARLLANLWKNKDNQVSLLDEAAYAKAMAVSQTIRDSRPRAQMPHFDYIGCMDTLAQPLNLVPSKDVGGAKGCTISPRLYQPNQEMAQTCHDDLEQYQDNKNGSSNDNVPRVVLNALVGTWDFRRTIRHFDNPDQQESVTGVIQYSKPSSSSLDDDFLLYREDGEFHYAPGKSMTVFREYEYIHSQDGNLEIYFVETGKRAGLFLSLKFTKQQEEQEKNNLWVATSDHLCIKDLYKGTFEIRLDGIGATQVTITYRVKGPQKDYESVTELRPAQ